MRNRPKNLIVVDEAHARPPSTMRRPSKPRDDRARRRDRAGENLAGRICAPFSGGARRARSSATCPIARFPEATGAPVGTVKMSRLARAARLLVAPRCGKAIMDHAGDLLLAGAAIDAE